MSPRRISRWLLPVSLSLNVFLAVAMAVQLTSSPGFGPPPPRPRPDRIAEEIAATMTPADGDILREVFASHAPQLARGPESFHALQDRIRQVMTAPTFDAEALRAVFAEGRQGRTAMDDAVEASLIEAATRLSPEGRRKLGEWRPGPPRPSR
jgi:uncharacterized membrane protein